MNDEMSAEKRMRLRRSDVCRTCGTAIEAGTAAIYERATKTVRCIGCDGPPSAVPQVGKAGASARREYERRRAKDEASLRAKWGRWGGVAVALSGERQSTSAWARGAVGEELIGAMLDRMAEDDFRVLHDRRIPGSRANIDHLVITPSGVWVVDPKRYKGRPALRVDGGIIRPRVERLTVAGRDKSSLVDGMLKQVGVVRELVEDTPVRGVLCFVDADWPLVGGAFSTRDVDIVWPKRLKAMLREESSRAVDVGTIWSKLGAALPPA